MSKPAAHEAQAAPPASCGNIVTDLRSRDQWMIAFNEAAGGFDVSAFKVSLEFVVRLGNRIALHHRCKPPHRCDPGEDVLANEMQVSERKVLRGIAALKALGWIAGKRGGRDDNVNFTLCIPYAANGTPASHLEPENDDLIPDNKLSPMDAGPYLTKTASIPDTQCVTTKEQRNREERSAAAPRASGLVEIDGPATSAAKARAYGALDENFESEPLPEPRQELSARDQAYYTCSGVYANPPRTAIENNQCRAIFFEKLDRGIDAETIISAAERCIQPAEPLINWLQRERWKSK
jgi:hypothetical protein